ncbi:unnamed protein product [Musa textilis]
MYLWSLIHLYPRDRILGMVMSSPYKILSESRSNRILLKNSSLNPNDPSQGFCLSEHTWDIPLTISRVDDPLLTLNYLRKVGYHSREPVVLDLELSKLVSPTSKNEVLIQGIFGVSSLRTRHTTRTTESLSDLKYHQPSSIL